MFLKYNNNYVKQLKKNKKKQQNQTNIQPIYLPKSKMTFEVLGFTKINPKKPIKLMTDTIIYNGFFWFIANAILPMNSTNTITSIKYPLGGFIIFSSFMI